jgi:hypothetical protein
MNFPSTNTDGVNPAHGDIVSNVGSSHGVKLSGGSTGGIIEPAGDDANVSITLRGKGTGAVVLGNSSSPVTFSGNTYTVQFTPPTLAANTGAESTFTCTGLSTGQAVFVTPRVAISNSYAIRARCSTANELTVWFGNITASTIGSGESTNRFRVAAF